MLSQTCTYCSSLFARLFSFGKWKLILDYKLPGYIQLSQSGDVNLECLDIVSISISKALLWHTVDIHKHNRINNLSGLSKEAAMQLVADIHVFINIYLFNLISKETNHLLDIDARLRKITKAITGFIEACRKLRMWTREDIFKL